MKGIFKKAVILTLAGMLFFLSKELMAQESAGVDDDSSPAVRVFNEWVQANKDYNYEQMWDLTAKNMQRLFGEDINQFENWFKTKDPELPRRIGESKITKIVPVSPTKTLITFSWPGGRHESYVIATPDGWKIYQLNAMLDTVKYELNLLKKAIESYYSDNIQLPSSLDDLIAPIEYIKQIPLDPLRDSYGEPYAYIATADSCKIYSFGPDGNDDSGLIEYEPKDGFTGDGDIVLNIDIASLKN